jgi:hypothetical protein
MQPSAQKWKSRDCYLSWCQTPDHRMKLLTRRLQWLMDRISHYSHMYVDLHRQNWLYGGNSWYRDSAPKFSILWVEAAGLVVWLWRQSRSARFKKKGLNVASWATCFLGQFSPTWEFERKEIRQRSMCKGIKSFWQTECRDRVTDSIWEQTTNGMWNVKNMIIRLPCFEYVDNISGNVKLTGDPTSQTSIALNKKNIKQSQLTKRK